MTDMRPVCVTLALAATLIGCKPSQVVDPGLTSAIAQARASLTNFISVLQSPNSNQTSFCVYALLSSGEAFGEGAYANVWKYEDGCFRGVLTEDRPNLRLTNNQPVSIEASNVIDWLYLDFGRKEAVVGNFTARALHGGSNPQAGANGRQPLRSDTNRTSAAAASRRSP